MVWPALIVVYLLWGSTYLGIGVLVQSIPPLLGSGARFLLAGVILAGYVAATRGWSALRVDGRELATSVLLGFLALVVGNGGLSLAEQHVETGLAALIVAATPVWIALLRSAAGDRPGRATWLGVGVGIVGLAVLVRPGQGAGSAPLGWILLIALGSFTWALGGFLQQRLPAPRDPLVLTCQQMISAGVVLLVLGPLLGERLDPAAVTTSSLVAFGYLVVAGSLVGYVAYVWLVGNAPLSLVSTYAYVNPVVAVILGVLILGERVTATVAVGGAIILAGVVLIVSGERLAHRRTAPGGP